MKVNIKGLTYKDDNVNIQIDEIEVDSSNPQEVESPREPKRLPLSELKEGEPPPSDVLAIKSFHWTVVGVVLAVVSMVLTILMALL